MNQLAWRGETVNGKYLGEVSLLTDLSPIVHCESFVDGHWRLWSYIEDKEQVIQQGKSASLEEAKYICEQTALAIQGLQGATTPVPTSSMPYMPPTPMIMPNMYMQSQAAYEEVNTPASLQELRFKFRRWAISLTLMGGVFLSIWYSMLLKPVSTISMLLVLASIIWGTQALIKSFKSSKVSVTHPNPSFNSSTMFPTSQGIPQMAESINQLAFARAIPQALPQLPIRNTHQIPHPAIQQQAIQTDFYNPALQMQYYHRSNG